jgi:RNA polymerase sigma factor (TIGR02999 family)
MSDEACDSKGTAPIGDLDAEQLLPILYSELRRLAAQKMAREAPGQTIQATALVHEAYVRLMGSSNNQSWNSRGHFFGAMAEAMRRILVDRARHKLTVKAGGAMARQDLPDIAVDHPDMNLDIVALNEALEKLEKLDERRAKLVKLRFFAGLSNEQAAEILGISSSTADNDWAYARSWLLLEIQGGLPETKC